MNFVEETKITPWRRRRRRMRERWKRSPTYECGQWEKEERSSPESRGERLGDRGGELRRKERRGRRGEGGRRRRPRSSVNMS